MADPLSLVIAGADVTNPNLGCAALGVAAIEAIRMHDGSIGLGVLDGGRGTRGDLHREGPGDGVLRIGFRQSRHPLRGDWAPLSAASIALGIPFSASMRRIAACSAILDVSGGDSFTDLYGRRRFDRVNAPKRAAVAFARPLALLPQTYGPFTDSGIRREASSLVRAATTAWARDARSFEALRELLGDAFDPARHRCGVDMAFLLEPREPSAPVARESIAGLRDGLGGSPLVGFNVSGLLANDPSSRERFRLVADYRRCCADIVLRLLASGAGAVLLVPHVLGERGVVDSDPSACEDLREALPVDKRDRVFVARGFTGPSEAKWVIGNCDFFCGTRMHATIAALSQGVPCATVCYSDKALGVFEAAGCGGEVVDPRIHGDGEVCARVLEAFHRRAAIAAALSMRAPSLRRQARDQMGAILSLVGWNRA